MEVQENDNHSPAHQIAVFRQRLAETIAWCEWSSRTDLRSAFRTPDLRPQPVNYEFHNPQRIIESAELHSVQTLIERQESVAILADKRAELLKQRDLIMEVTPAQDLAGGRLLVYNPDNNLCDGASEAETYGFFDWNNIPPWDTWVFYAIEPAPEVAAYQPWGSYLISWIPPSLIEIVNDGINVNPEVCIDWADKLDVSFINQLRDANLLA